MLLKMNCFTGNFYGFCKNYKLLICIFEIQEHLLSKNNYLVIGSSVSGSDPTKMAKLVLSRLVIFFQFKIFYVLNLWQREIIDEKRKNIARVY